MSMYLGLMRGQGIQVTTNLVFLMFFVCPIWLPIISFFSLNEPGLGALINLAWFRNHFHLVLDETKFEPTTFQS